jgi:hypothetical protein
MPFVATAYADCFETAHIVVHVYSSRCVRSSVLDSYCSIAAEQQQQQQQFTVGNRHRHYCRQ